MDDGQFLLEFIYNGGMIFVFIIIVVAAIMIAVTINNRIKFEKAQAERVAARNKTQKPVTEKKQTVSYSRTSLANYDPKSKMKSIFDDDEHHHAGDEYEIVEEYTGSLGGESTEGCKELRGVRFLTKTTEDQESETEYDYDQIAMAMVLGSAFSEPKYKD